MARTASLQHRAKEVTPRLPSIFEPDVPAACQQIALVLADSIHDSPARLWRLERDGSQWIAAGAPIAVSLGRNGLAWGLGEHSAPRPPGFPIKREGDGRSPAGVFCLGNAFGYAIKAPELRLPYRAITRSLIAVDDPASRHYNQIVDSAHVACDWQSKELMLREDGLYRWGAGIKHNPTNIPGAGSCIFLHLWRGPGQPTAGCTAMAECDLIAILRWLDPEAEPRWVQSIAPTPAPV